MTKNGDTLTIGGRRFKFGLLPPDRAFKVFMILVRNFGGALVGAGLAGMKAGKFSPSDKDRVLDGLTGDMLSKLSDTEIQEALEALLGSVSCLDQTPTGFCSLNTTFNGQLFNAFYVAFESAKVNFADFLGGNLLISRLFLKTDAGSSQSSQPTSTGSSGSPA